MKDYSKKTDELLIEMAKQDEDKNKRLLTCMWILLISTMSLYTAIVVISCITIKEELPLLAIIVVSTIFCLAVCFYALKLEVEAGYYECRKCHHRYKPSYKEVLFSMHMSTTRYLKCPKCNKRSWSKKVMTK